MSKGQVFIIIAIIVVVVLILIRTSLNLADILDSKRFFELGLERQEYQNMENELAKVIQISYNHTNISSNVNDFFSFSKEFFRGKAVVLTGIGLTAQFSNVSQNVDTPLNVTVMNYFDENLDSLNLTFDNNQHNFTNVLRSSMMVTSFTFSTANSQNYSLLMTYKTSSVNSTENITIPVEIGTTKFISFFDIKLSSNRLEQKDKFTQTVVLNSTRKV